MISGKDITKNYPECCLTLFRGGMLTTFLEPGLLDALSLLLSLCPSFIIINAEIKASERKCPHAIFIVHP